MSTPTKPKAVKPTDKLTVQIAFVVSEKINGKIEKEVKRLKLKNKSEYLRTLVLENIAASKAAAK